MYARCDEISVRICFETQWKTIKFETLQLIFVLLGVKQLVHYRVITEFSMLKLTVL